ncbi:MAG: hypothetical protein R2748_10885 [Bryobacterales bacterium]
MQWRWYAHPDPDEPEAASWPSIEAMMHGGGMTWGSTTYDPELEMIYFGTGNPQPVIAHKGRMGDNLFTESIMALDINTGKRKWYFQSSPHDTHDWDANQTPVLIDGVIDGKPRKLVAQAARNGYFFVLDRVTGENIVSKPFAKANWAKGLDKRGQPIPDPAKYPRPTARSSRPTRPAPPTGRRRASAPTRACSTSTPPTPTASTTSTTTRRSRKAGRQRPRRLVRARSRASTTRPAKFAGATPGRAAADRAPA